MSTDSNTHTDNCIPKLPSGPIKCANPKCNFYGYFNINIIK